MNSNENEQIIKNNLISYGSEENTFSIKTISKSITKRQSAFYTMSKFEEASDWNERNTLQNSCIRTTNHSMQETTNNTKYFLIDPMLTRHRKLSHEYAKRQQLTISPINVKFRQKQKDNFQYSQKKAQFRVKHLSLSVYDSNYKPLSKLYQRVTHGKASAKAKEPESPLELSQSMRQSKFPRTEMISSIIRIMKRRQQMVSMHKMRIEK